MATGFTAIIQEKEGVTFREFALRCARGMGALIMLRDEPLDAPIPERLEDVCTYHVDALARAKAKLEEVIGMSVAKCEAAAKNEHDSHMASYRQSIRDRDVKIAKYEAMLANVNAWVEPTPNHTGLRNFMIQQLTDTIQHDSYTLDEPKAETGAEWYARHIASAKRDIAYHSEKMAEDEARRIERQAWIDDLRKSL